ncbi:MULTISPECIES: YkvI family membrane protein [Vitreoscilla]|uniref:Membrane protein YkvI n=1 Tax=Vitreoscilla stercoraria TaxID=61 RepID=A0ABY4E7R5_VITST|nr:MULTISPECIES: hypothetical protein [Vitreoscilla]AUZ04972.1 hypothetical protein ADP71_13560 [Vitreoscilla sp. C1]UOO91386.1 hypothetical protein LVJ81_06820 [Vitreoscilla stercoraria]
MAQTQTHISWGRVLTYAGAFIAFLIGSGFATGQEVMQYFTAYGYSGILGILVVLVLFCYVGREFVIIGNHQRFENGGQIYEYLCGRWVGRFFDYFSILFIYMSFIVMIGGTGATVSQQYDLNPWIGALGMGFVVALTVICGLDKIVDVLGKVGPAIVVLTIILGGIAMAKNPDGLVSVNEILPSLNLMTASGHWFFAATSYVGFCMLWLAGFMSLMGSSAKNLKEITRGAVLGACGFSLALAIIALGLMANLELVAGSMVPTLKLAGYIHPMFATVFSVIVLAGIYTTAVPLLWQASARFTNGKSAGFKILTVVLTAIGVFVGMKIPFDSLVNAIYVINGYVGIVLLAFLFIHTIQRLRHAKVLTLKSQ